MTYEQAMRFWFGRVNFETRTPRPDDLSLERMRLLLALLGNPDRRFRIVHIAGSKGKGSTSAMLATILEHSGYRAGLFTSPHLVNVEERIQVNRLPITGDELAQGMEDILSACRSHTGASRDLEQALTFFEIGTALGFLHFVRRRVEVAMIEVGLGGRFDSTNVCRPALSIITSISFDHTQVLGDTLPKIAMEKAGIVKPGRPVLSGVRAPEARAVIETICRQRRARLYQVGADYEYVHEPALISRGGDRPARVRVTTRQGGWPVLDLGLMGEHQARNAALAVAAVEELRRQGMSITDRAVSGGLAHVSWPARLEVLGRRPLVLLDCAHNVASAQALIDTLQTSVPLPAGGRRFLIFAASRDKDLEGMLRVLAPRFDRVALTRFSETTRGVSPHELAQLLPPGTNAQMFPSPAHAWNAVRGLARDDDLIVATGSVFLAGELRPLMI